MFTVFKIPKSSIADAIAVTTNVNDFLLIDFKGLYLTIKDSHGDESGSIDITKENIHIKYYGPAMSNWVLSLPINQKYNGTEDL